MEHDTYQPIACALHDRYELAIMRRQPVLLAWLGHKAEARQAKVHQARNDQANNNQPGPQQALLIPIDLLVSQGEEFLLAHPLDAGDDRELKIRLDKILSFEEQPTRKP